MERKIKVPSGAPKRTSTPTPPPRVIHERGPVKGNPLPNKRATSSGSANPPPKR